MEKKGTKLSSQENPKTKFAPPEMAARNAWARTTQLSSNEAVRSDADRAKKQMDDIKADANAGTDDKEKEYVNQVYSAIESTFRNLATARNELDLRFSEVTKLREKQTENLDYISTFSHELQSLVPRLGGMTIGGATVGILVNTIVGNYFPPVLKPYATPLVLAFGAAIGYFVNGILVVPWVMRRKERDIIKSDHDRILCYARYVTRAKAALKALYNTVDELHNNVFGARYNENADVDKVVDTVLGGMEPSMCKYVADHIGTRTNGKMLITADLWSMCETNQDVEECKYWPHNELK